MHAGFSSLVLAIPVFPGFKNVTSQLTRDDRGSVVYKVTVKAFRILTLKRVTF